MSDLPPAAAPPEPGQPAISIIIPVLNEAAGLAATLAALRSLALIQTAEIIVADGGSADRTVALARQFNHVRVIECGVANRGRQLNAGARLARGEWLLFLHADARLPHDALVAIRQAAAEPNLSGGCFQLRFPNASPRSLALVAWGINLRTRLFRTATGDQAIFVRRARFAALGGYQELPLMEDIAFFTALKRQGRVAVLEQKVEISPRRWLKHGVWRTVLLMYALRLAYWFGVSPATLKRFFVDVR